jgi:endonuclease-8
VAEGDTIMRIARRLDRAFGGLAVAVRAPSPRGAAAGVGRLDGRRLERAEPRGKHHLLHFGEGLVLHSHLGMKGAWHLYRQGDPWRKPARSAWVALAAEGREAVQFGGTTMRVLEARQLALDSVLGRLGPDILSADFDPSLGVDALHSTDPSRQLGDALLDQRLIAGIGNIFKSEGCFAAGVDPWRALGDLPDEQLVAVVSATRELMAAAAESGRQQRRVYHRSGRRCGRCGSIVRSGAQGDSARVTYWCPDCQE